MQLGLHVWGFSFSSDKKLCWIFFLGQGQLSAVQLLLFSPCKYLTEYVCRNKQISRAIRSISFFSNHRYCRTASLADESFGLKFWCSPASCVTRTDWEKEQQRQKNLDKQHRISKRNSTFLDKPGITTLLNLTVLHYSLAFLDDWLLSFNVFFSYYFLFLCKTFHLWTDT